MEKVKNYVETVLQPKLQGDGGWVEYVSLDKDELTLIFRGECSKCLILNRCTAWIEEQIKKDLKKKEYKTSDLINFYPKILEVKGKTANDNNINKKYNLKLQELSSNSKRV